MALRYTHNLIEGAAAAPIAAARKLKAELADQNVAMVMSGANLDTETSDGYWVRNRVRVAVPQTFLLTFGGLGIRFLLDGDNQLFHFLKFGAV